MRTEAPPLHAEVPRRRRRVSEPQSDPPASGANASGARSHRGRWLAGGALALALVAVVFVLLTRDDEHTYRFIFENAGQLVEGDVVRVGGTPAGTCPGIELTNDSRAEVTVSVKRRLRAAARGTTATIRAQSLIGVANRYVDISARRRTSAPSSTTAPCSRRDNTTSIVDLDQLFNALDPPTRKGLQQTFKGFAAWYERQGGRGQHLRALLPAARGRDHEPAQRDQPRQRDLPGLPRRHLGRRWARSPTAARS